MVHCICRKKVALTSSAAPVGRPAGEDRFDPHMSDSSWYFIGASYASPSRWDPPRNLRSPPGLACRHCVQPRGNRVVKGHSARHWQPYPRRNWTDARFRTAKLSSALEVIPRHGAPRQVHPRSASSPCSAKTGTYAPTFIARSGFDAFPSSARFSTPWMIPVIRKKQKAT